MEIGGTVFDLPGFRFHPTEEELLNFYLRHKTHGKKLSCEIIGTIQLYRHEPWDLPKLSMIGEREWYFFVPRDRVQVSGKRPNRTTVRGFWKATGTDRTIRSSEDAKRLIGYKKTLVFYTGRAPRGCKTDWVMNEYRLPSIAAASSQEDIVLCKVYRKATSLKELEQRAAMEEENGRKSQDSGVTESFSSPNGQGCFENWVPLGNGFAEAMDEVPGELNASSSSFGSVSLPEIPMENQDFDSMLQPFPSQLQSPWMEDWSAYANFLDF